MINHNQYRKVNDKKTLRKVRKRWLIVSTALLSAIGMGVVSSVPTHADTVNGANEARQQTQEQSSSPNHAEHSFDGPSINSADSQQHLNGQNDQRPTTLSVKSQFTSERNISVAGANTGRPTSIWTSQSADRMTSAQTASSYTSTSISSNTYTSQSYSQYSSIESSRANSRQSQSKAAHPTYSSANGRINQAPSSSISSTSSVNNSQYSASKNGYSVVKSLVSSFNDSNNSRSMPKLHLKKVLRANSWNNSPLASAFSRPKSLTQQNTRVEATRVEADKLSDLLHHNSWNSNGATAKGYHLKLTDSPDVINVIGNPVTYKGTVTLQFLDRNGARLKDITEPYSVNSQVGAEVTVVDPNKYLDQTLQGFNTSGFKADENASDFTHIVQSTEGPKSSGNVIDKDYTLSFTKTAPDTPVIDTDTIDYLYNGNQVGSTTMKGANGSQGTVDGSGLSSEYHITSNDTFIFDNGTHDFSVSMSHPQPKPAPKPTVDTDMIEYMYNGTQVGDTVPMRNTAGDNGIAGVDMPSGYRLADDGSQDFTYDGSTHQVDVEPIAQPMPQPAPQSESSSMPQPSSASQDNRNDSDTAPVMDTDVIDYVYGNKTLGSTVMHGQNGITATADGSNLPSGYKIVNDGSSSFAYDDGTHYVNIEPINNKATDNISFVENGKSVGDVNLTGPVNGPVDIEAQLPQGYQLNDSAASQLTYDGLPHDVNVKSVPVKPVASKIIINYVDAETGTTIHTTPITGKPGAQFNYQQFDNLVPVGGYAFLRIDNPIAQFTDTDQVMTVSVMPKRRTSSARASNTNDPSQSSASSTSRSMSAISASVSKAPSASASSNSSNNMTSSGSMYSNAQINNKLIDGYEPSWYGPDNLSYANPAQGQTSGMSSSASMSQDDIDNYNSNTASDDSGYDRGYQDAYRGGRDDASTGQIHHARAYIKHPTAYLKGYRSYPSEQYSSPQENRTTDLVNDQGQALNIDDDDTDSDTSQDSYYQAPAVGSLWDNEYEVFQDQDGEYIIVNGIKLYWDPQSGQFDLVLTENGLQKYDISQLGL